MAPDIHQHAGLPFPKSLPEFQRLFPDDVACAEEYLPIVHLIFSNLKSWLRGCHHGVSPQHLQAYLNEFAFRFNRRFYPFNAFRSLLGIGGDTAAPTYASLYSGEWKHATVSGHD